MKEVENPINELVMLIISFGYKILFITVCDNWKGQQQGIEANRIKKCSNDENSDLNEAIQQPIIQF